MIICLGVCVRRFLSDDAVRSVVLYFWCHGCQGPGPSCTKSYIPEVMLYTLLNRNNPIDL